MTTVFLPRVRRESSTVRRVGDRPKLGLDLDGVVFAWDIGACTALRMRGVNVEVRESTSWGELETRITPQQWKWLWNEGVREAFKLAPVYTGVVPTLRAMQELVDICVVTHRPRAVVDITLQRLAELRLRPTMVLHVQGREKTGLVPDPIAFIDDRQENVEDLVAAGVMTFYPRKPWNTELDETAWLMEDRVQGYDSIEEVLAWLKSQL